MQKKLKESERAKTLVRKAKVRQNQRNQNRKRKLIAQKQEQNLGAQVI